MKRIFLAALLMPTFAFASKAPTPYETGTVISQDISSSQRCYAVVPIGAGIVGAPIMAQSDVVVIETATQRMTWIESGRKTIVLPVNRRISFYREGDWYVVIDGNKKKHKFGVVHLESLTR